MTTLDSTIVNVALVPIGHDLGTSTGLEWIAGAYIMADDIPAEHRGQSVQIFLDGGECRIAAI
jgi:hypothetical protein